MSLVVLPTEDIVAANMAFDPLFFFVPEGVMGVVKEAVHSTSFRSRRTDRTDPYLTSQSQLAENIIRAYEQYLDEQLMRVQSYEAPDERFRNEMIAKYVVDTAQIEYVIKSIEEEVAAMMHLLFKTALFDIREEQTRWLQRDLIVWISTMSSRGRHGFF